MDDFDIPIFKKTFELYKEFYLCLKNFPRQDRYSIGQKCEIIITDILEYILLASQTSKEERMTHLEKASSRLNLLRVYIRLSKEICVLDKEKYLFISELIDEIGRMLGGWRRSEKKK